MTSGMCVREIGRLENGDYTQSVTSWASPAEPTTYMAPSWSWASTSGIVTLDLLAEDVTDECLWTVLISISDVTLEDRVLGQARKRGASVAGSLEIFGPLSKIDKVQVDDGWSLFTRQSSPPTAVAFPDVSQDEDDLTVSTDLWCLPCLALTTLDKKLGNRVSSQDIQGLVIRRVGGADMLSSKESASSLRSG